MFAIEGKLLWQFGNKTTLRKVQKILRNATVSENTFQSFNVEVYEKFVF